MTGRIIITGISDAEKAAKEILGSSNFMVV